MANTNIDFLREKNGYDRKQVDSYIEKLSEMYQKIYNEYINVSGKYKELLESGENAAPQERTEVDPEIVAKTLMNAEMLAQRITVEAQAEAAKLMAEAQRMKDEANVDAVKAAEEEAQKVVYDAYAEVARAKEEARRIINDANAQAVKAAEEQAWRIINEANAEAARAKDEAQKIINDANAVVVKAEEAARKIINDTNLEAVRAAEEEARKIINDANIEAARVEEAAHKNINEATSEAIEMIAHAKNNIKLARKKAELTASEIEELLAFQTPERIKMEQALSEVEKLLAIHTHEQEQSVDQWIDNYKKEKNENAQMAIVSLEELNRVFTSEELGG